MCFTSRQSLVGDRRAVDGVAPNDACTPNHWTPLPVPHPRSPRFPCHELVSVVRVHSCAPFCFCRPPACRRLQIAVHRAAYSAARASIVPCVPACSTAGCVVSGAGFHTCGVCVCVCSAARKRPPSVAREKLQRTAIGAQSSTRPRSA